MFYTVYKITNKINGKFYIGKHQTTNLDDGYMGSGKHLRKAIEKYGVDNFVKEILGFYPTVEEMNQAEKDLVILDESISYNLCPGGHGGFGFINANTEFRMEKNKKARKAADRVMDAKYGENWRSDIGKIGSKARCEKYPTLSYETAKRGHEEGWFSFKGRKHSDKTLALLKEVHKDIHSGEKNSQFGTCWINNGIENKKIKKIELDNYLSLGYIKGRKMDLHR
jgi:hypothetical protein